MPAPTRPLVAPLPAEPLTQAAAEATQGAAQASVVAVVENPTQQTRTVVGTLQTAAQTTAGGFGMVTTATGTGLAIGHYADLPELEPTAWGATLVYQGIKHWRHIDQDHYKWFILPLLGAIISFGIVYFATQGNLWEAASHCMRTCWLSTPQSLANYHLAKPLGWFSSADEIAREGGS